MTCMCFVWAQDVASFQREIAEKAKGLEIVGGGIPGTILVAGRPAFPLVAGRVGKASVPVAAAATFEKGRIVALSHEDDAATNAGELKATQYYYDVAVRDKKTDTAYNLLAPSKFAGVFDKISKNTAKLNLYGVSLDTLASTTYSDYSDKNNSKYYSKNSYTEAAEDVVKKFKAQNKKFMASAANDYAAVYADIITEAPVSSDKSHAFMYDVPFYQMVFKGSVPITVQSINLAADPKEMILKAVESGSGLGYTVIDSWDSAVINSNSPYFYNTVYSDLKNDIYKNAKALSSYYNSISGKHITGHTVLENGLRETVFENGVVAYVNYTDKPLASPAGEVAASGYLITEK